MEQGNALEPKFSDFITVGGAATILGVSKETVRKWEREGKLKSTTNPMNGYRMFREADLKEILCKLKERRT